MKILSLNTWGGRAGRTAQLDFFRRLRDEVDVFCLQEIWSTPYENYEGVHAGGLPINHRNVMTDGLEQIVNILGDHEYFFNPHFGDNYGLLMFVRKGIDVKGVGEIWVYKERGYIPEGDIGFHPRNLQYAHITYKESEYIVCNFHGFWNGKGKTDCDERIEQSERIAAFLEPYSAKTVIIGDFNLLPDTESISILERAGYRNLVSEYGVTSTRTSLYSKSEKFADYAFVGSGIAVKDFKILPDEVSDHAPLLLEIE